MNCNQDEAAPKIEFALRFLHILHKPAFPPAVPKSILRQCTCTAKTENMFVTKKREEFGGENAFSMREYEALAARPGNERKWSVTYPHEHHSRVLGLK